jgi:intracellular sulfur oxidation DsrE/DsrF family protein
MTPVLAALALMAAGPQDFSTGPVIEAFGPAADIADAAPIPAGARFRIAFDLTGAGDAGAPMPGLVTAARFLNMHARAGVEAERMELALVIHGGAAVRALADANSAPDSADAQLITQLTGLGHRVIVCGQSAAFQGLDAADMPDGVETALSAMTVHALLQQDGYTLNPF